MLTPQIRLSLANWAQTGLLRFARERILFVQGLELSHCAMMAAHPQGKRFEVVGNEQNVGIPPAQAHLIRAATSPYVLYMERDYVTDASKRQLEARRATAP